MNRHNLPPEPAATPDAALVERLAAVEARLAALTAMTGGQDHTSSQIASLTSALKALKTDVETILQHNADGEIIKQSQQVAKEIQRLRSQLKAAGLLGGGPGALPPILATVINAAGDELKQDRKAAGVYTDGIVKQVAAELRGAVAHLESIVGTEVKSAANALLSEARFFGSAAHAVTPSPVPAKHASTLTKALWS